MNRLHVPTRGGRGNGGCFVSEWLPLPAISSAAIRNDNRPLLSPHLRLSGQTSMGPRDGDLILFNIASTGAVSLVI